MHNDWPRHCLIQPIIGRALNKFFTPKTFGYLFLLCWSSYFYFYCFILSAVEQLHCLLLSLPPCCTSRFTTCPSAEENQDWRWRDMVPFLLPSRSILSCIQALAPGQCPCRVHKRFFDGINLSLIVKTSPTFFLLRLHESFSAVFLLLFWVVYISFHFCSNLSKIFSVCGWHPRPCSFINICAFLSFFWICPLFVHVNRFIFLALFLNSKYCSENW